MSSGSLTQIDASFDGWVGGPTGVAAVVSFDGWVGVVPRGGGDLSASWCAPGEDTAFRLGDFPTVRVLDAVVVTAEDGKVVCRGLTVRPRSCVVEIGA